MFAERKFYLFAGKSQGSKDVLLSFDLALINAGVGNYNHVKISSIRPPFFQRTEQLNVASGSVLFTAYASQTGMGNGIQSSAVAIGVPIEESDIGVIMEYSCNDPCEKVESKVREMVSTAMENRKIKVKEIFSISCQILLSDDFYSTTIAGVALW